MENFRDDFSFLVASARLESGSALGILLENFRPLLQAMAKRTVGRKLRVRLSESDLVQETLMSASVCFRKFRGTSEAEFRQWLLQIFRSRLADAVRRHVASQGRGITHQTAHLSSAIRESNCSPSELASREEQLGQLVSALVSMDERDRRIMTLRYEEQLSFEEIALRLDMPLATLWRRWAAALRRLRREIHE